MVSSKLPSWGKSPFLLLLCPSHKFSLGDRDDDVRSVAASCLLPVAGHLVEQLPETLGRVLVVLWHCLSDMKDDLSSSVGAVMDLLGALRPLPFPNPLMPSPGKLVSYDQVIAILADDTVG